MRNQIVILAAGKGARMGSDLPKVLVMLRDKPVILHLLETLDAIPQLARPVVVVGHKHRAVMDVLGDGYLYAYQDRQLGTGHALMCAEKQVSAENILVLYGDMPFIKAESLKKLMQLHRNQQAVISMLTSVVDDFGKYPSLLRFGRIIRDRHGNIAKITEYKDATEAERQLREVNPGIYMFRTAWLWEHLPLIGNNNSQGEYYLTDAVEAAIADGQFVHSLAVPPREVLGINNPEELLFAERML